MNNSFARLIEGMNATLRSEVLPRLADEFARGQVFGVINLLNTFKARADWSAGFLLDQIEAQRTGLQVAQTLAQDAGESGWPSLAPLEATAPADEPCGRHERVADLLETRDAANRAIGDWLVWLDAARATLPPRAAVAIEDALRTAMRAEVDIELKNSPRPLFAEMSSGREA